MSSFVSNLRKCRRNLFFEYSIPRLPCEEYRVDPQSDHEREDYYLKID